MVTLWNLIRDWFVQYIWGGTSSTGYVGENFMIGSLYDLDILDNSSINSNELYIETSFYNWSIDKPNALISIGDWLSTTSTIIVLILLLIAFGYMVVGIFRLFSRMFSLRS